MYVRAGCPAFARPCVGVHKSTSLMSSSLLLQQCPACLVRLTWIVFVIGGRWPYSWCLVGCCRQDLFFIIISANMEKFHKFPRDQFYYLLGNPKFEKINDLWYFHLIASQPFFIRSEVGLFNKDHCWLKVIFLPILVFSSLPNLLVEGIYFFLLYPWHEIKIDILSLS